MKITYLSLIALLFIPFGCRPDSPDVSDDELDNGGDNLYGGLTDTNLVAGDTMADLPAPLRIEAECAFGPNVGNCDGNTSGLQEGTKLENNDTTVGYIEHSDYLSFIGVDLTLFNTLTINYAKALEGGTIQVRLDSLKGQLIGTISPAVTGGWTNWRTQTIDIPPALGQRNLFLLAVNGDNISRGVVNLDWLEFSLCPNATCATGAVDPGDTGGNTTTVDTGGNTTTVDTGGNTTTVDTGGNTTTVDTGGSNNDQGLPPIGAGGSPGTTTRYWDCCKPHCGWHSNMKLCDINNNSIWGKDDASSCDGGNVYQCWDYTPIVVNSKLSYGWAAFNSSSTPCGECYQLDFHGALEGKQMIVQIINIGDGGGNAFDLLIPGGGVGQFNGCSKQWGYSVNLGTTYGGFYASCNGSASCVRTMCQAAFGDKKLLMDGCEWFLGWFENANNPSVTFKKTTCPAAITAVSGI